jgi:HK97 family phage portal protein
MAEKRAFLERFVNKFVWNVEKRGSVLDFGTNNWDKFLRSFYGGIEKDSDQEVSADTGTGINTVFNCLNVISQDIATFPKQVRRDGNNGKEVLKNQLYNVLNHFPNQWENAWQFWYGMVFMGEGWGNSYAYVSNRNSQGYATELIRLKPWCIKPEIIDGELWYKVNEKVAIHNRDMFHYRSFVTDKPWGESKIIYNAKTIGMKLKQQKYAAKSVGNKPPGILFIKGATEEQREANRKIWNEQVKGENIAGTPVLHGDIDYKNIMLDPVAAEIIEQNRMSDQYLMGLWRIQPSLLSMHEKSNYNVVEQQSILHVKHTLMPIATNLEQEIFAKLFPEKNKVADSPEYVKFNFKSLLRGDTATQTAFYQFLTTNGIANADEIREWEDLPPQGGGVGKTYYIQGAMIPKQNADGNPPVGAVDGDQRTLQLLEDFAKKHKLNGYARERLHQEN